MSIAAYLSNILSTSGIVKPAALGTGTPSSSNFLRGDGAWSVPAIGSNPTILTYDASGTWTKATDVPAGCTMALIEVWGAGGGAARGASIAGQSGGGGGAYSSKVVPISSLGATETVTVGAAGLGATATGNGGVGGNSSFGSWVTGYGGAGGFNGGYTTTYFYATSNVSGGGGTNMSGQYILATTLDNGVAVTYYARPQIFFGGNGCMYNSFQVPPSMSMYGGGGGGSNGNLGGPSTFGGAGGNSAATPTAGTRPGGGGAGSTAANTNGSNGGGGRVKVTMW